MAAEEFPLCARRRHHHDHRRNADGRGTGAFSSSSAFVLNSRNRPMSSEADR
jgi:hypothetical protein